MKVSVLSIMSLVIMIVQIFAEVSAVCGHEKTPYVNKLLWITCLSVVYVSIYILALYG